MGELRAEIARLRASEKRLRASEQRLRGLFERFQEGFVLGEIIHLSDGGLDFRYIEVNEAWEQMMGISRAEAVGHTLRQLLPDVAGDWMVFLSEVAPAGTSSRLCRHMAALDRWLDVSIFQPVPGQVAILLRDISERKQVFDSLRESEDHYKHTVELNPQIAWTAKPSGQVDRISQRWSEWTGLPGLGDSWEQGLHPDDRQKTMEAWLRAVTSGTPYDSHHRVKVNDGSFRWMHTRAFPRYDQFGEIIRWYGTTEDVHDRYSAEEALRVLNATLEARIRQAVAERDRTWANSRDLQVIFGVDGTVKAANPALKELLGYEEAEILGDYLKIVHPDDMELAAQVLAQASREGVRGQEVRAIAKDGSVRLISWVASPPENGLIYASGRDVTAERAVDKALREAEARARSVFESSYLYQGYLTPDGILTEANSASLESIRARREDVIGKPFWETPWFATTPGMPEEVREAVARVRAGQSVRSQILVNLPIGRRIFDFSLRPALGTGGEVVGLIPEAVDLTDWKNAEEQVGQKLKMEAIGQLTGGIAHDFNNLLTPIIGALDTLRRRTEADERAQRLATGALQAADRARTLIQRLLSFSRKQHLEAVSVDLRELLEGVVDMMSRSLGPCIEYEMEIPETLPPVRVDPNQLELALLNVAINGRDAMGEQGRLTVSCSLRKIDASERLAPGEYVAISISDTGCGMDEEARRRAVEPFFTTKGVGHGTGLGLSMVYGLAVQSGGDFELQSEIGKGTTATIWLPVSHDAPRRRVQHGEEIVEAKPATILLVDDEDLVRAGAADMLAEIGYTVLEAGSASEALEVLKAGARPDILVTDYAMPSKTGAELAREAQEALPGLPVLLITGYAMLNDETGKDFPRLAKPFHLPELASQIAELINRSGR